MGETSNVETRSITPFEMATVGASVPEVFKKLLPEGAVVLVYYQDWLSGNLIVNYRMPAEAPAETAKIDRIAMVAHEVNRAYCASIGDNSQAPWDEAPEWQRDSARNGVRFHIANPQAGPSASHDNWMAQKLAEGWVYGPVKDPDAKQHPCIAPYQDLPPAQRAKDHLFICVVRAFHL